MHGIVLINGTPGEPLPAHFPSVTDTLFKLLTRTNMSLTMPPPAVPSGQAEALGYQQGLSREDCNFTPLGNNTKNKLYSIKNSIPETFGVWDRLPRDVITGQMERELQNKVLYHSARAEPESRLGIYDETSVVRRFNEALFPLIEGALAVSDNYEAHAATLRAELNGQNPQGNNNEPQGEGNPEAQRHIYFTSGKSTDLTGKFCPDIIATTGAEDDPPRVHMDVKVGKKWRGDWVPRTQHDITNRLTRRQHTEGLRPIAQVNYYMWLSNARYGAILTNLELRIVERVMPFKWPGQSSFNCVEGAILVSDAIPLNRFDRDNAWGLQLNTRHGATKWTVALALWFIFRQAAFDNRWKQDQDQE